MATLINKMVSWAAREAEERASKSGMSLEKAAEEVADKYGQRAFSATAKPAVEEFATSTPSMFLGDANAPRNKSLRELVSPGVEESITAREASRYTEPGLLNRPVSGAGEKAMLGVQESTIAREASRYNEPDLPQYSREAGPEYRGIQRGFDPNAPMPPAGSLRAGLAAGAAGTAAIAGGMALRGAGGETSGAGSDAEKEQWKARKAEDYARRQIPFTEEDLERQWNQTQQTRQSSLKSAIQRGQEGMSKREAELENIRELQRREGIPEESISASLRKATPKELEEEQLARSYETFVAQRRGDQAAAPEPAEAATAEQDKKEIASLSTPELKKQTKKQLSAVDTTAKKAQADANAGKIPQAVADDFKAQRDEAYRRYDEAKSRNEWLELAQILGQAATQYGAAQVGMRTGRAMGGLQIPGVNYEARTGQEARLLESRLRDIGEAQTRQERLKEREQERADTAKYRQAELVLKKQDLEDKALERAGKMSAEERLEKTTLRDSLTKQLANTQKQYQAALTFANQAAMEDDLSSKTLKKIEEKTPGLLGQAGIDPTDLQKIEKAATKKGFLGWSSVDPETKQQLIKERILDKHRNMLDSIQAQLNNLAKSKQPVSAGQPAGQPATIQQTAPAPLSPEDQQALDWAKSNPNDPRAAAIRQRLGR